MNESHSYLLSKLMPGCFTVLFTALFLTPVQAHEDLTFTTWTGPLHAQSNAGFC